MAALGEALSSRYRDEFARDLTLRIRKTLERIPRNQIRARVDLGAARAEEYGLTRRLSLWRYLHLVIECGDLETMDLPQSWAQAILQREDLPEKFKVQRLWRELRSHVKAKPYAAGAQ
jgi:hypothetical protein